MAANVSLRVHYVYTNLKHISITLKQRQCHHIFTSSVRATLKPLDIHMGILSAHPHSTEKVIGVNRRPLCLATQLHSGSASG
jgi:hypothetical protein